MVQQSVVLYHYGGFNSSHAKHKDFLQEENFIVMEWCIQFCQMAQC